VRLLGHGGSGVVYLGEREGHPTEPQVAVKLLIPGLVDEAARQRFRREAESLQELRHPNVVRMLDSGITEDGTPYLVRERVEGLPIDQYCDEHRLSVSERIQLMLRLCDAVAYAHRRGVVHGDLKPGNVLVEPTGTVRLIDFSSAARVPYGEQPVKQERIRSAPSFTPDHASPERLRGDALARTDDIYAVGVLLYELLTGQVPRWSAEGGAEPGAAPVSAVVPMTRCLSRHAPEDARDLASGRRSTVPGLRRQLRALDVAVQRALHPDPDRRYQEIEDLAAEIIRRSDQIPSGGLAEFIRLHPLIASLLGAGVAGLAARALLVVSRHRD